MTKLSICIIGKYPPIEGGVSTQTYWLAHGLASRGHDVHVVTNADEVEPTFRMRLAPEDGSHYQPSFANGGSVRVYTPLGYSRRAMFHIPEANPFVSKLASVATDVIREHGCGVVFAYYFEPYGVAGYLTSRWTSRPLIVRHAGSDLDRLLRVPDLATTYKEILCAADAVVTKPRLMPRFTALGMRREQLEADIPYSIPTEMFRPTVAPADLSSLVMPPGEHKGIPRAAPFDPARPVVGVYGKIGSQKGTFDLVRALGLLARQGLKVNLVAMIGEGQAQALTSAVRDAALEECTYVAPFLPNWHVPAFLRACTVVCSLERDFEIAIHLPVITREVLASGTCLVVSREIVTKQRHRDRLRHGENLIVIDDPRDHESLARALRPLLTGETSTADIGERGAQLSAELEQHGSYLEAWEGLLARHARPLFAASAAPASLGDLEACAPAVLGLLRRHCAELLDQYKPVQDVTTQAALLDDLYSFVASHLVCDPAASPLLDMVRHARARARASCAALARSGFAVQDQLRSGAVTQASTWALRPVRSRAVWIESFECDVAGARVDAAPEDLAREPQILLFHRSENLIFHELRIDTLTQTVIEACDGTRTTAAVAALALGADAPHAVLRLLDWLYRQGMIVFGEYRTAWGWTGGLRGGLPARTTTS